MPIVKKSQFLSYNENGELILYHFDTDSKGIKIYDKENNKYKSFHNLYIDGETISDINLDSFNKDGKFIIKNVESLPSELEANKEYLLFNKVFRINDTTTSIIQELYDKENKYVRSIRGESISDWVATDKNAVDRISSLEDFVGIGEDSEGSNNLNKMISELENSINIINNELDTVENGLKTHNHDKSYIKIDDIVLSNDKYIQGKRIDGGFSVLLGVNPSGHTVIGTPSSETKINGLGKSLTYNGSRVWSEGNHGSGSGMNADLLDGSHGSEYAKLKENNTFEKEIKANEGVIISGSKPLNLGTYSSIYGSSGGNMHFKNGSSANLEFNSNGELKMQNGNIVLETGNCYIDGNRVITTKDTNNKKIMTEADFITEKHTNGFVVKYSNGYMEQYIIRELTASERTFLDLAQGVEGNSIWGSKLIRINYYQNFVGERHYVSMTPSSSGYMHAHLASYVNSYVDVRVFTPLKTSTMTGARLHIKATGFWK